MLRLLRALGRWLLLAIVRLLPARRASGTAGPPRSVLVVRTDDRVGNLLLTTPLLAALRGAFPSAQIGLLCAARRAQVVEGTGLYDQLWRFEKRDFFRRPWAFWRLLREVRRQRYDVAIEAGHFHVFSFTSAAVTWLSGAPLRIGHRRGEAGHFLNCLVEKDPNVAYDAATKLELLAPLGVRVGLPALQTALGLEGEAQMRALLGPAVVLNPGARKADHRWPVAKFAAAAMGIANATGLAVWIAWGPGEETLARDVAASSGAKLLPPTDLASLAAAFRAASVVVTNDTGPLHLSVAVGAPTIAIFLNDDRARWCLPGPKMVGIVDGPNALAEVVRAASDLASAARLTGPVATP